MSVLIKGMEMPNNCKECDLYIDGACYAKGYRDYRSIMDMSKPDDCQLIEVPPHGRLIDADAFKETIDYYIREAGWSDAHNEALGWVKEFIDNEHAVIEAED